MNATRPQSAVDSTCAQSEVQKLASRHDSMLPFGQLHDAVIDRLRTAGASNADACRALTAHVVRLTPDDARVAHGK